MLPDLRKNIILIHEVCIFGNVYTIKSIYFHLYSLFTLFHYFYSYLSIFFNCIFHELFALVIISMEAYIVIALPQLPEPMLQTPENVV